MLGLLLFGTLNAHLQNPNSFNIFSSATEEATNRLIIIKKNNSNNCRRKPYVKQIMTKIGNGRPSTKPTYAR